jgi:hypothetical protein
MPQQNRDENSQRAERDDQQRPCHRQSRFCKVRRNLNWRMEKQPAAARIRFRIFSARIRLRARAISGARNSIPSARFRQSSARASIPSGNFPSSSFVADVLDFFERVAEIGDGFDHLLGIAAG